jgi:hypothetical protein
MSSMKINGLTLEQERAANIIASGVRTSNKQIAKAVNVTVGTIKEWKGDSRFKVRVLQIFDDNVDLERGKRYKKISTYLKPVYQEIRRKLNEEGALEHVSLKELLIMMARLHQELRTDANLNKSFLDAGIKEYGEEEVTNTSAKDDDDLLSRMSSDYEGMRKDNLGKNVVRLKAV